MTLLHACMHHAAVIRCQYIARMPLGLAKVLIAHCYIELGVITPPLQAGPDIKWCTKSHQKPTSVHVCS